MARGFAHAAHLIMQAHVSVIFRSSAKFLNISECMTWGQGSMIISRSMDRACVPNMLPFASCACVAEVLAMKRAALPTHLLANGCC